MKVGREAGTPVAGDSADDASTTIAAGGIEGWERFGCIDKTEDDNSD